MGVFSLPDRLISTDRVVYVGIQILMIILVLMKGNLEVYFDKNHSDIHAIAQLPKIALQARLSGDMID